MNNNTIETYEDLLAEKSRLEIVLATRKASMRKDVGALIDELNPLKSAFAIVKKAFTRGDKNTSPAVNIGLNLASDIILKKFLLARAGWFTKLVVPYLVKNYSSHLIAKNLVADNSVISRNIKPQDGNFLQRFGDKLKNSASTNKNNFRQALAQPR